jgi:phosphoenolpyruvate carboxykinase (GTP)
MSVDRDVAAKEAKDHEDLFDKFLDRLPKELMHHRELFKSRLWRSPEVWELARSVF